MKIDLLNIANQNIEQVVINTIEETKEELKSLTKEQTCKIYSSYIKRSLDEKHVLNKIINTKDDLDFSYEHEFVLVPDKDDYYLIDLTYEQFGTDNELWKLHDFGYEKMTDNKWKYYLKRISQNDYKNIDMKDVMYKHKGV